MSKETSIRLQYSGSRVEKAGKELRKIDILTAEQLNETMNVLSYWRQAHEVPLQRAVDLLQKLTRPIDKSAIFANRMKRTVSISTKLERFKTMSLYKMQDIGGCRVIIRDKKKLKALLRVLKKQSEFQISLGKPKVDDYILNPKSDGYRSTHIIGKFPDNDNKLRFIEVQLRTPIQHYWATAVEIVDLFTKQSLKTNQGQAKWKDLFKEVGKQFELMDNIQYFTTLLPKTKYKSYCDALHKYNGPALLDPSSVEFKNNRVCYQLIKELNVIELLNGFAQSLNWIEEDLNVTELNGYVLIIIDLKADRMSATVFSREDSVKAEQAYIKEEKGSTGDDRIVAMVATPNIGEIRAAYPNYFADSTEFLKNLSIIYEAFEDLRKSI
jgi:ppGpp synthetase/RelA/SpoT-type nucleotidyltranferase